MTNLTLIQALRATIAKLENGATYKWTHMGHCICGNLVQSVTKFSAKEIHEFALEKAGDWRDQTLEYCGTTGYTMDYIIETLLSLGLKSHEIAHLERLSDYKVLSRLPVGERTLDHRKREDVLTYLKSMVAMLEEEYSENVDLQKLFIDEKTEIFEYS